jgi:hypothetical protein
MESQETVRYHNGYKVTRRPIMQVWYEDGCKRTRHKKHIDYTTCPPTETLKYHATWEKCGR